MERRELLQAAALMPLLAMGCSPASVERAAKAAKAPYTPTFFTEPEWRTVRVLADLIVPKDARSGSATEAGVPEFMDFILTEYPDQQTPVRGGLAWLERECRERFGKEFAGCTPEEQTALLDEIAYPKRARPEMSQGVAFFTRFRDLVLSGFWSSKMGVEDLGYLGNKFVGEWTGCPVEGGRETAGGTTAGGTTAGGNAAGGTTAGGTTAGGTTAGGNAAGGTTAG